MSNFDLGESIPPHTAHAVSVSLPTWQSNVGYEEGEEWVVSRMTTGYPRFFIHRSIEAFATELASRFAPPGQRAFLFPTRQIASRCLAFVRARSLPEDAEKLDAVHLILDTASPSLAPTPLSTTISAVFCTPAAAVFAKEYWQHTGDGVSSRRAEFYHGLFNDGLLRLDERPQSPVPGLTDSKPCKGPRRYQRPMSLDGAVAPTTAPRSNGHPPEPEAGPDAQETSRFLEERFGRNKRNRPHGNPLAGHGGEFSRRCRPPRRGCISLPMRDERYIQRPSYPSGCPWSYEERQLWIFLRRHS